MTEAEVQQFMRIVRSRIKRYHGDQDYDDILQESCYWAYRAYLNAAARGSDNPLAVVWRAAGCGPAQWLRRWYGDKRRQYQQEREPDMPYWELEQIAEWAEELPAEMRVPVYQMEPALLGQVWAEQVLALMAERCTSREWETIERVVVQGQAIKEAAAEMGVGIAAVCMSLRRAGRRVEAVLR